MPVHRPIDRRRFIAGCAAAAIAAHSLDRDTHAAESPSLQKAHGRIDVHHHILPPGYVELAREEIARTVPEMLGAYDVEWTPQRSLEAMDRNGVTTAVVSISAPGIWLRNGRSARKLARVCNEYAAGMKRDHPGRFGMLAALPLPDVDGCLKEIEYARDVLRADGFGLMTSYGNRWPGAPEFAPVFDELNRRKAVVYVHPTAPGCCATLQTGLHAGFLEFPFDSTRAIASLLYSGTLTRCPDIRFVFSHGGGALPSLHARLLAPASQAAMAARFPHGPLHELRKLYFDTASATNRPAFAGLSALVPMSQILFGSDYPLGPPLAGSIAELGSLGLDESALHLIERDNAAALFPSL